VIADPRLLDAAVPAMNGYFDAVSLGGMYAMLAGGAIEEVASLAARQLDPLLPAMKAHGVPVLIRHIRGEVTRAEAAEFGRTETRQYAKRQSTWFRHQLGPEWQRVETVTD